MTSDVSARDGVAPSSGTDVIGPMSRQARSDRHDVWLRSLFEGVHGAAVGACLVAVGSYGRRELAPGSDLDLVLLHPAGAQIEDVAQGLWYPVWDAGVRLDHSVRTIAEARRLAARDEAVLLGLLDARVVAGDEELLGTLRTQVLTDWRAMAASRLPALQEIVEARRTRSGDLAHLLEPDLKESYGGLRDATVLRAIAASWIADSSHADVDGAARILLDVRDALHNVTGRGSDRLVQQEQDGVAEAMRCVMAVDGRDDLLRTVSRAARTIAFASDTTWQSVERATRRSGFLRRLAATSSRTRIPLAEGVVVQDDVVVLAAEASPATDPVLVLRAAAAAAQANLRLSPHTVTRLAGESAPMPRPWPREARDALIGLLGAGRSTIPVWESLDQAGLISQLLPEWEVVRGAPQRDPMHRFTVDRHLVEAAVQASSLTRRVARPDLLVMGALLHDIGKARGRDHTVAGVELVGALAPDLGFDRHDTRILVDLVRWHLLLAQMATRRDIDDPSTARAVAERVPDAETLELLHMLAIADAHATGPTVSSDWRLSLIDGLVDKVRVVISGQHVEDAPALTHEGPWPVGDSVEVSITPVEKPFFRLGVVVRDQHGLLAAIANVLAVHRLDVRAARTQSTQGHAVMEWFVTPIYGQPPEVSRIREDIRLTLSGSLDIEARLTRARRSMVAPPPALVRVHSEASARATVIEVRAHDEPGLLGRVASGLTNAGVDVIGARVDTRGSDVVDVFYVVGPDGGPLADTVAADVGARLESGLNGMLNDMLD
jgi:[protein-PII] uridylyltransferase